MMDSLMAAMPNLLGTVFAEKKMPVVRHERTWGGNAMYNIYATSDGKHIVLGGAEMHFAKAILTKLGRPDLIEACEPPPGPSRTSALRPRLFRPVLLPPCTALVAFRLRVLAFRGLPNTIALPCHVPMLRCSVRGRSRPSPAAPVCLMGSARCSAHLIPSG